MIHACPLYFSSMLVGFSILFKNNFEKQHKPRPFFGVMSVHEFYKFHYPRSIVVILLN